MRGAAAGIFCLLAACATAPDVTRRDTSAAPLEAGLLAFRAQPAPPTRRSNASIARDFLDLTFRLENGASMPAFTRMEGPLTLRVVGRAPPTFERDLADLLHRLRREAGIDIDRVPADANARITVELRSRKDISRASRNAACFVAPGVSSWSDYRAGRAPGWTTLTERSRMMIVLPTDASPQLQRDCLHEEVAQALGPVNDLYRLDDSVLNDDNLRGVLTGFDMLILKTTYDPALRSGLSAPQVAARLPAILDRINPRGRGGGGGAFSKTPSAWKATLETALTPGGSLSKRRAAAKTAVTEARRAGWYDNRLAFALLEYGRLSLHVDDAAARDALFEADRLYAEMSGADAQAAKVGEQIAALHLSEGRFTEAIAVADRHVPAARAGENAALLATLLFIKAEALAAAGRPSEARGIRAEAVRWARYGFGSDRAVRAQIADIAALTPTTRNGAVN